MRSTLDVKDIHRLEALAGICIRCFFITVASLLFVWMIVFLFGDRIHRLHNMAFELSRQQLDWFVLGFLTFIKSLNVVLFLFPYVAMKLYLRGLESHGE